MMRSKWGVLALGGVLSAIIFAAATGNLTSAVTAVSNGVQAMVAAVTQASVVAPDQAVVSLSGELPAHDPTVGRVDGNAGTSGGAATYTIPIALPPSRRGMQPDLALSYSSRAGNGIAGVGWSLSGLSSLHRCPATIEQDGVIGAVSLTNADKLCLDGQRLVATSGAYGQPNTTYDTELESFVRVTQLGGDLQSASTYFEVETKSGDILWYGNNSIAANPARVVQGGVTVPLSWMIARKEDRVGNFIRYSYANYGNGEVLLSDVFYTGFQTTDGDRSVHLTYAARPSGAGINDQSSSYLAGGVTMQTQRLTAISTWSGTSSDPSNKVREYDLAYAAPSQSTSRSLLASVTECGFQAGTSVCRPPTTFAWQQGPMQTVFHPATVPGGLPVMYMLGDLDGDGSSEILAGSPTGTQTIVSLNADRSLKSSIDVTNFNLPPLTGFNEANNADFDGDGRADLMARDANNNLVIYFWDGPRTATTFAQAFTRSWNTGIQAVPYGGTLGTATLQMVRDMDGDGRPDLVLLRQLTNTTSNCSAKLEIYRNVANPLGPSQPASFPLLTSVCMNGLHDQGYQFNEGPRDVMDLNGDGVPDILLAPAVNQVNPSQPQGDVLYGQRGASFTYTRASYASLFPASDPEHSDEADGLSYKQWLDVNGDGLKDLLHADLSGTWSLRLNTGHGLGNRIAFSNKNGIEKCYNGKNYACLHTWTPVYASRFRVADMNGDGRQELLIPRRFATQVCAALVDYSNPAEPQNYYACPEDPVTGLINWASVSNLKGQGIPIKPAYGTGVGDTDNSAYLMNALSFVQTGPNQFQIVESQTSRVDGSTYALNSGDMYGDGLEDTITDVSCPYASDACALALGGVGLPGGYPPMSSGPFINEAVGPNGQANPDGKTPQLPDLMSMVTDGMGAQTVWTYYPLSSTAGRTSAQTPLYTVPTDPAQKYVDSRHVYFTSSMPVVSDMASSDGIGGYHSIRYGYSQAMYNTQGRGFQGFRTITEEDTTVGLRTTTTFNQKFPLAGQVADVVVNALTRNGTDGAIKHEVYNWRCNRSNRADTTACTPPNGVAAIKFPFLDEKDTWTYDSGVALQATGTPAQIGYTQEVNADDSTCAGSFATASGFDAYGNLTAHTVLASDSGTGTAGLRAFVALQCLRTRSTYTANTSTWWLDQINSTTTTSAITYNTTNHPLPAGASNPAQTVTTNFVWNADRTLQSQTVQSGVANQQKATAYGYPTPSYGLPGTVTVTASGDPNGARSSSIGYSADGYFPSSTTNPLGQQTQTTVSPRDGQPTLAVDANGLRTLMTYDAFGQLIKTQFHGTSDSVQRLPDKLFARSWCANTCLPGPQALFKTTDVQDGTPTKIVAYDLLGRTLLSAQWAWDNTLPLVLTQYNAQGWVSAQSNPYDGTAQHLFWTTFQYDALGRITQKIVPKGADDGRGDLKTTYTFSGLQTAIQVCGTADVGTANCLNMTRTTDSMGKYMETLDAQNGRTQYWTDATGNTLALMDAKGSVTNAVYNALGQRSSVSDPNQGTWSWTYDALGEVLTQTDARNVVTSSSYDKLGRPLTRNASIDVTGDGVADAIADSWSYDPLYAVGAPATSQRLVNGAIERKQVFTYDTLARPVQTDTTQQIATGSTKAYTQTIAYDSYYGRPKSLGYPNGEAVATYYSKYGIPIRSFNPADNSVYREVTAVDLAGNPTNALLGGGILAETRSYRIPTSELLSISYNKSGAAVRRLDYQTDVFGNLRQQSLNSGATVENYAYDTLQRMTQATRTGAVNASISYAYDAAGNFTSKSDFSTTAANAYTYTGGSCGGGANAVKSVAIASGGSRSYCYDADGNLTSDSAGLAVKYDHDNLAFQTTRGSYTINLAYGPDNQRTREWGSDGTKVYLDGGYEDWISQGSSKVYVGTEAEISNNGGTRTVNYLLTDRLGSVDSIADSTGTLVETRGSDAFGKPRSGTWADLSPAQLQSTAITARGFTEHEHLNSVQLIHMNGRVYDYQLGRFLSVDPFIQFPLNSQSMNPYSYILNNPLAGKDPTGYLGVCDTLIVCSIGQALDPSYNRPLNLSGDGKNSNGGQQGQGAKPNAQPSAKPDDQTAQIFPQLDERKFQRMGEANPTTPSYTQGKNSGGNNGDELDELSITQNILKSSEKGDLKDVHGIILHRTGGSTIDSAINQWKTDHLGTHFVIDENGNIVQTAHLDKYTAHIGKIKSKCFDQSTCSAAEATTIRRMGFAPKKIYRHEMSKTYPNRYPMNQDSIGIEVVGAYNAKIDSYAPATSAQLNSVQSLVGALQTRYSLTNSDVYTHSQVSYKAGNEGSGLGY